MALAGALMALLAILSVAISRNPTPSTDVAAMDWVVAWIAPGLAGLFKVVSFLTSAKAALIYGPVGIALLLFLRKRRAAVEFAVGGGVVALVAVLGDYTLGEAVGRTRPLGDNMVPSFPSGHVFGSTVLFGFSTYLAVHHGLRKRVLVPIILLFAVILLAVGPARVHEQAHWPSDVAAGYLLGAIWLLVLIPAFIHLRRLAGASGSELRQGLQCRVSAQLDTIEA